jgi:hypothetical protein
MADKVIDPFFAQDLEKGIQPIKYDDVIEFLGVILKKGATHSIIEELEGISEYIIMLEKLLEENKIPFDDDELKRLKLDYEAEIKDKKQWLLLYFAGKIVKREGP